jgi:hypothetical protein
MSGKVGGWGVVLSAVGLSGTGGGPEGAGVAVTLSGEPGSATCFLAWAGAVNARAEARTRREMPVGFNMGKSFSIRGVLNKISLHRFLDKPQAPGLMPHLIQ